MREWMVDGRAGRQERDSRIEKKFTKANEAQTTSIRIVQHLT